MINRRVSIKVRGYIVIAYPFWESDFLVLSVLSPGKHHVR